MKSSIRARSGNMRPPLRVILFGMTGKVAIKSGKHPSWTAAETIPVKIKWERVKI
jgi:hypothetical protein